MIRLFQTHRIRGQRDLEGVWDFAKIHGEAIFPEKYEYKLPVPGCWEQHPELLTYRGKGAYRKEIVIEEKGAMRLEFKGVSHTAQIWFDGLCIGEHYNAYTPFEIILPHVEEGKHELVVVADNSFHSDSSLHVPNDYYSYGGITRGVVVEQIAPLFLSRIEFVPSFDDGWTGMLKVVVRNVLDRDHEASVTVKLAGKEINFKTDIVPAHSEKEFHTTCMFENVQSWSPSNPALYELEAHLYMGDTLTPVGDLIERVGFRTVEIKGQRLLVNGEVTRLKGFNRHEDFGIVGCSLPLQLMVKDLELIKQTGANAVRTCHYPNDELFLDLCDEMGIYLWEENHARGLNLEQMKHPLFMKQSEDCIREMIHYHVNHPSIVIWGLLNECASHTPEGCSMYETMFNQVRSLDSSRPVTSASKMMMKDLTFGFADIVSLNIYSGWYDDNDIAEYYHKVRAWLDTISMGHKPIILSEFGAAGLYGYRDPARVKWSEERQGDLLDESLAYYMNQEEIIGVFIWQFADCRVTEEGPFFQTRARTHNNKGVVDDYRRPKLSYEVVKKHFMKKS